MNKLTVRPKPAMLPAQKKLLIEHKNRYSHGFVNRILDRNTVSPYPTRTGKVLHTGSIHIFANRFNAIAETTAKPPDKKTATYFAVKYVLLDRRIRS